MFGADAICCVSSRSRCWLSFIPAYAWTRTETLYLPGRTLASNVSAVGEAVADAPGAVASSSRAKVTVIESVSATLILGGRTTLPSTVTVLDDDVQPDSVRSVRPQTTTGARARNPSMVESHPGSAGNGV